MTNKLIGRKARILVISLLFSLLGVSCNQILLYKSVTESVVGHCRRINQVNISAYGLIEDPVDQEKLLVSKQWIPDYCNTHILSHYKARLSEISINSKSFPGFRWQLTGEKLRIYAESFDEVQAKLSDEGNKIVALMLALNVLALIALALFLEEDAKSLD